LDSVKSLHRAWGRWLPSPSPVTYWLEAIRRTPLGASGGPTFGAWSDAQIVGALAVSTLVWGVISVACFRYAEHRARALGLLDWQTQY